VGLVVFAWCLSLGHGNFLIVPACFYLRILLSRLLAVVYGGLVFSLRMVLFGATKLYAAHKSFPYGAGP